MRKSIDLQALETNLKNKEELRKLKAKYKSQKRMNKHNEKKERYAQRKWFNFFTKWFFLGLFLVLLSICLSLFIETLDSNGIFCVLKPVLIILAGMLSTVGIALFVGCVFDFSKNSEAFIKFVSDILSNIVVSKKFLSTLSIKDKEQALNLILKPMDSQVEQYANINDYFKKKIKESMTMFDTNFKTNLVLNINAHKDSEKKIVCCETTLTYTIYRMNNKFEPIKVYFEKNGSASSDIKVISAQGEETISMGEKTQFTAGGVTYDAYSIVLPEDCEKYDHLTIKRTVTEPGKDHWINYIWQSLTPYEGISCRITCHDNLTVKDFMIFDNRNDYTVELSKDQKRLDITSTQWLDADTGFSCVISE